ncbi:MAG TPA: hypothetical protein VF970_13990 [Gemmatimonadales bacterium]
MSTSPWPASWWFLLAALPATSGAQQVDTVRVGSQLVQPSLLAPGTYVHESFRVDGPNRTSVSRTTQTVEAGREAFVIRTMHAASSGTSQSVTVVRRSDLAMVHHAVRAPRDSTDVTMSGEYLTGWTVLPNTPTRLMGLRLDHPVFPIEGQIPWLMGLLPLKDGYRAAVPHFSEWDAREVWDLLEVQGSETIQVGDAAFDCWKVDAGGFGMPGYRMTRWIDRATRRVVQSALRGAAGQTEYWSWTVRP